MAVLTPLPGKAVKSGSRARGQRSRTPALLASIFTSWSLLAALDAAKRMKATTIELPSSHVSMISHPKEITALIVQASKV